MFNLTEELKCEPESTFNEDFPSQVNSFSLHKERSKLKAAHETNRINQQHLYQEHLAYYTNQQSGMFNQAF